MDNPRLSKLMSERGLCSRREADQYIEKGWVQVNGETISELGTRVAPDVEITLDPRARQKQQDKVTILLHKPIGYVSGQPEGKYPPAVQLITAANQYKPGKLRFHAAHTRGLAPAGRLDIDSNGLLVLTQDGRTAKRIISGDPPMEKEYLVRVEGEATETQLAQLRHGLSLDGRKLRPATIERLSPGQLRFVLTEGMKRQIRRMCELVGLRVTQLKRVRIGKVRLADLPRGKWRYLGPGERF